MTSYAKSLELGLTGTDAQIVNNLQTLTLTDIKSTDAVDWLSENGHWQEGPTGMTGTLAPVYTASTGVNRKKFDDCWIWLYSQSASKLLTTRPSQASRVWFLISQIPSVTTPIRDSFYDLGGGRPYKTLTDAGFATSRTDYLALQAAAVIAADLASDWAAAQNANINAAVYDRVALVAALRLSADQLEVG